MHNFNVPFRHGPVDASPSQHRTGTVLAAVSLNATREH